ncbi:MAG: alpha-amylase family glycosyl hydrolase [Acholeplasma sp.]|nr:alpha-amylase family glycosyl hydrolase [Acholeplasma sp.]
MKKKILLIILLLFTVLLVSCDKDDKNIKDKYQNDVYYSLFVRSFADSNNDGIGDLKGVTNNLAYFEDLGITAIWLLPIFESPTYHGYDTLDYYKIQSEYGTMEDFEELVSEAKKKDIKIILDFVINHTSDQHPWYLNAKSSSDSEYRDFYVWNGNSAAQSFPGGMVDLNLRSEKVKKELFNIVDFYMDKGVSGFRIDAVRYLFTEYGEHTSKNENIIFMSELESYVKEKDSKSFVVGEAWLDDYNMLKDYYMSGASYFNFYISNEIKGKVGNGTSSYLLSSNLERMYNAYRVLDQDFIDSPFLGNHDMDRIASSYGNHERLKQAVRVLLTLPGNPFIYYGDELGLKGTRYEGQTIGGKVVYDEYRRQPFIWGDSRRTTWLASDGSNTNTDSYLNQKNNESSMFNVYKEMIALRKNTPALMYGNEFYAYSKNLTGFQQAFLRVIDDENYQEAVLVIHNLGADTKTIDLDLEVIFGDKELKPLSTVIFKVPFERIEDFK